MATARAATVHDVADSYLTHASEISAHLPSGWSIDAQWGRRLEKHTWDVHDSQYCSLAVISGNDFHKKSGRGAAGILAQVAWDNHKKSVTFERLQEL